MHAHPNHSQEVKDYHNKVKQWQLMHMELAPQKVAGQI